MESTISEQDTLLLNTLLDKVYRNGGHDFRDYKRGTIIRRLERRLHATGAGTYLKYTDFLDTQQEEYEILAEDLTIKVSDFFRSEYTFKKMTELVLTELIAGKKSKGDRSIKFWSTACACGEEPYSLAIMLSQFLGEKRNDFDITIYATDISRKALSEAQKGTYSREEVKNIPAGVLRNYFHPYEQGYKLNDDIIDMVRFSHFDLVLCGQPPFTGLDAVFCCNILIYFQRHLQEKVLNMVLQALSPSSYLILGEAETPACSFSEKLECLDSKARIYKKLTG
jgi:two-component system, chemotaxis family, CheB/CheR fusion protein